MPDQEGIATCGRTAAAASAEELGLLWESCSPESFSREYLHITFKFRVF